MQKLILLFLIASTLHAPREPRGKLISPPGGNRIVASQETIKKARYRSRHACQQQEACRKPRPMTCAERCIIASILSNAFYVEVAYGKNHTSLECVNQKKYILRDQEEYCKIDTVESDYPVFYTKEIKNNGYAITLEIEFWSDSTNLYADVTLKPTQQTYGYQFSYNELQKTWEHPITE